MEHLYFILSVCVCLCVCVCAQDSESRSLLSPPVSSQCFPSDSRLGEEMGGEEQLPYRSEQCLCFSFSIPVNYFCSNWHVVTIITLFF